MLQANLQDQHQLPPAWPTQQSLKNLEGKSRESFYGEVCLCLHYVKKSIIYFPRNPKSFLVQSTQCLFVSLQAYKCHRAWLWAGFQVLLDNSVSVIHAHIVDHGVTQAAPLTAANTTNPAPSICQVPDCLVFHEQLQLKSLKIQLLFPPPLLVSCSSPPSYRMLVTVQKKSGGCDSHLMR